MGVKPGRRLTELNMGRLVASGDAPGAAGFMAAHDRVGGPSRRMSGPVRMTVAAGGRGVAAA